VQIGSTFKRYQRLVRDLARETGKEVLLAADGGETELDKTMIEKMHDPLTHLIRNCVDHGIESPAERELAGKPRQGVVRLSASQSGSDVVIAIRDDGAGLDFDAIRAVGIGRGLIPPGSAPSERDLARLLFLPGFSTCREVTSISGRGVGLDVVKKSVEELQGKIDVDSRPAGGTCFTITLPLTLAIIEGLHVEVGGERYILPLSTVEECVELIRAAAEESHGQHLIWIRDQTVPYIRLRDRFGADGEPPPIEQVVVVRVDGRLVGLAVDHVVGEHQTVIKSLGKVYRRVAGVSGATILGDGRMALILDITQVVRAEETRRA
jgi:two-component system chemotaxis sensor kinase CheA